MEKTHPTTFVIFGATGDLFRKKLAPALLNLFVSGSLPNFFRVVAFSRRPWNDAEFRNFFSEILGEKASTVAPEILKKFLEHVFYAEGDFDNEASYKKVAEMLTRFDNDAEVCMNKLFYLATPPTSYEIILKHISASGLAIPCAVPADGAFSAGWTRILIEKPFGSDLENARRIDLMLGKLFSEEQIFRIDHYLAKETVQNILTFRFANALFEPVWNRHYIERVEIRLFEKGDVGTRGSFYDGLGALRDVGQNHLLQLSALVAMENPVESGASALRKKRAGALAKFKLWGGKDAVAIRGQYDGYTAEAGVAPNSQTETYFKIKLALPNSRFKGVPFILESGKAFSESKAEVAVYFKQAVGGLCPAGICPTPGNVITFHIQPKETISLSYWAKKPGLEFVLESQELALSNRAAAPMTIGTPLALSLGAYERVLIDAIRGDQTLFTSTAEVLAEWRIVHSIFQKWHASELTKYPKGTPPWM